MAEKTVKEISSQPTERGANFLFWALIATVVLNLVMVIGALTLFGP